MVQFAGIPFAIIFGRLPAHNDSRAPFYLAFVLINAIALPIVGVALVNGLPATITGTAPAPYLTDGEFVGEGAHLLDGVSSRASGEWERLLVSGDELVGEGLAGSLTTILSGRPDDLLYRMTTDPAAALVFSFRGKDLELEYRSGPDGGVIGFRLNGEFLPDEDNPDLPLTVDSANPSVRYGETFTLELDAAGNHVLEIVNMTADVEGAAGAVIALATIEVLPPARQSSLPTIAGIIIAFELAALLLAWLVKARFAGLSNWLDTRRSIQLALLVYSIIACWGFFLDSTLEFWMLALMVAMVQGGSQALSRSLYASLCPTAKSGEFFGFYGIMEKFASIIGPLIFALAAILLGSSRPAILSLVALFAIGGYLLTRVDVAAGQRAARAEDAEHALEMG